MPGSLDPPLAIFIMVSFAAFGLVVAIYDHRVNHAPFDWRPILSAGAVGLIGAEVAIDGRKFAVDPPFVALTMCAIAFVASRRYRLMLMSKVLYGGIWFVSLLLF